MNITKKEHFQELTAYLALFYALPIFLISFGILPFSSRHIVLVGMGIILVAYAISQGIKPRLLGLRGDNLKSAFGLSLLASLIMVLGVMIGLFFGFLEPISYDSGIAFFIFYVFLSAPLQEFVFRCLMIYEMGRFTKNSWVIILFSALIYSFAHAMYHSLLIIFITLIAGIIWGYIYVKRPNFWAVVISHAIVGAITIFFGLI